MTDFLQELEQVKKLPLRKRADFLMKRKSYGQSMLMDATAKDLDALVELLKLIDKLPIKQQILIFKQQYEDGYIGGNVLHYTRSSEKIKLLLAQINKLPLDQQASIFMQKDRRGWNAFASIISNRPEAVESLFAQIDQLSNEQLALILRNKNADGSNALMQAVQYNPAVVESLLTRIDKLPLDQQALILMNKNYDGKNVLMMAASSQAIVESLLTRIDKLSPKQQASILVQSDNYDFQLPGYNALMYASEQAVEPLLARIRKLQPKDQLRILGLRARVDQWLFERDIDEKFAITSIKSQEKINKILNFINELKDVQGVNIDQLEKLFTGKDYYPIDRLEELLTGEDHDKKNYLFSAITSEENIKLVLEQLVHLSQKSLVQLHNDGGLGQLKKKVLALNNPDVEHAFFKAEIQVQLAAIKEKAEQLSEPSKKAAQELLGTLQQNWTNYQKNPDQIDLKIAFTSALDKAKPVFLKTEEGNSFLKWLTKVYDYLFGTNELLLKENQEKLKGEGRFKLIKDASESLLQTKSQGNELQSKVISSGIDDKLPEKGADLLPKDNVTHQFRQEITAARGASDEQEDHSAKPK